MKVVAQNKKTKQNEVYNDVREVDGLLEVDKEFTIFFIQDGVKYEKNKVGI